MSPTESDFFCWGGGLKKVAACGLFGVLLWLLVLLVGVYVANVAAFAVLPLLAVHGICMLCAVLYSSALLNIILIIEQHLSTNCSC